MPIYKYKGIDQSGKEIKATIKGESSAQAKQKIRSLGVMLIDIKEQKSEQKNSLSLQFGGSNVSINDLSLMTRQLSTLIKARIQIVEALEALVDQSDNPKLKIILAEVRQKVNEGSSLANALADYPKVFDNVYINMVEAGESSGTLDVVLNRLADFTEARVKLKNKIKGAMTYPIIMVVFGTIMMGIIFAFVIPKITKIFVSMKRQLPIQTQISIWISDLVRNYWPALIFLAISLWIAFIKYTNTQNGKALWHRIQLNLPLSGELITMINVSRFCSTLATLLNSGVPILVSLKIVKNLVGNVHMQEAVEQAKLSISEGASLAQPLAKSKLFPSMVTHMISLGEKSGELEPMLEIIAENYQDQVESKLAGLTATLEPIMMIFMGLAVGFIVFSVIAPLMEINSMR